MKKTSKAFNWNSWGVTDWTENKTINTYSYGLQSTFFLHHCNTSEEGGNEDM